MCGQVKFESNLPSGKWDKKKLLHGLTTNNVKYGPVHIDLIKNKEKTSWFNVKLHEGKNREIRKIMEYYGLFINDLIRVQFGPFHLKNIERGYLEKISQKELNLFIKSTGGLWLEYQEGNIKENILIRLIISKLAQPLLD